MVFRLIVAFLALLCANCSSAKNPPSRPPKVPADAFWVGGPDGGAFIRLQKSNVPAPQAGTYDAWIYNDQSGDLWYSGKLFLSGSRKLEPQITRPEAFEGWDGERLHLSDGRTMEKTNRNHPTPR